MQRLDAVLVRHDPLQEADCVSVIDLPLRQLSLNFVHESLRLRFDLSRHFWQLESPR